MRAMRKAPGFAKYSASSFHGLFGQANKNLPFLSHALYRRGYRPPLSLPRSYASLFKSSHCLLHSHRNSTTIMNKQLVILYRTGAIAPTTKPLCTSSKLADTKHKQTETLNEKDKKREAYVRENMRWLAKEAYFFDDEDWNVVGIFHDKSRQRLHVEAIPTGNEDYIGYPAFKFIFDFTKEDSLQPGEKYGYEKKLEGKRVGFVAVFSYDITKNKFVLLSVGSISGGGADIPFEESDIEKWNDEETGFGWEESPRFFKYQKKT
jgi:hypothetical protein